MKTSVLTFVLPVCFLLNAGCLPEKESTPQPLQQFQYELKLTDAAHPERGVQVFEITQTRGTNGFPQSYRMHLVTDVCPDKVCEILDATIYWNVSGKFLKIECPPDRPLTKLNHAVFTSADYEQLNEILRDGQSALGKCVISNYVAHPDLDAVSGATTESIENSVVEGAAYTSWVLWHWANNAALTKQLSGLTRETAPPEFWIDCLTEGNPELIRYALRNLPPAEVFAEGRLATAVSESLKYTDRDSSILALDCLKKLTPDLSDRNLDLARLLKLADQAGQQQILDTLDEAAELSPEVLNVLSEGLNRLPYYAVHRILLRFEKQNVFSDESIRNISGLTTNQNKFIVRRARECLDRINR